ncbi:hypothetical protein MTR67_035152 [Solanum verrucosum]|uniref:Uncharacterized protein n=1 Tax=Solanum verrucosum TaxID=315347 RepID=A0AAF0U9E1_SOLVR|nr:hypothetical protein MTR67_035152 [Solanum verrucosum]
MGISLSYELEIGQTR